MSEKIKLPFALPEDGHYIFRDHDTGDPLPNQKTFSGHVVIYGKGDQTVFNTYIDQELDERAWEVSKEYMYKPLQGIIKVNQETPVSKVNKPESPEAELRKIWTAKGVSKDRQNELIASITAKAQPGAHVGPFVIPVHPKTKIEWTKGTFGAVYCDVGNYHISITRNIKNGHYDNNNRFVKIYTRLTDNAVEFHKEIPNAGPLPNAKKLALAAIGIETKKGIER